jgi:CheY-like chemotaxis protein
VARRRIGGTTSASSDAAPSARLCRKALDASVAVLGNGTECMATRDLQTPSILLVSNSIDAREVYTRALRASEYRVVNAATTVLAYQIAITRPTDIVVTDGHCAGSMSGLELTRRLRIHTRTRTVPIIVITSQTRRQDGELSIKAGQTCSLRDRYREMRYANARDGYSCRADVCRASRRPSTNFLVR